MEDVDSLKKFTTNGNTSIFVLAARDTFYVQE